MRLKRIYCVKSLRQTLNLFLQPSEGPVMNGVKYSISPSVFVYRRMLWGTEAGSRLAKRWLDGDSSGILYYCDCSAADLIMKLLVVDQLQRLTILGACEHSWMYEVALDSDCMFNLLFTATVLSANLQTCFLLHQDLLHA